MAASSQVYEDLQRKSCGVEKRNGREEEKEGGREETGTQVLQGKPANTEGKN